MSTQYPPATQPGTPEPTQQGFTPAPAAKGTDPFAILGLVFAFLFWPIGLVLSIIGIARTGKAKRPGRGLAIAGAIISVIAGVVAVALIALFAGTATVVSDELEGEVTATVGVGEPATVGDVVFTVSAEECGSTRIGSESFGEDAQGVFCLYDVAVSNNGTEPLTFDSSNVKAFAGEAQYDADGGAEIYLEGDNATFLEGINPGNTVEATVVFDVPADVQLDRLELSPGLFESDRAVVTLR